MFLRRLAAISYYLVCKIFMKVLRGIILSSTRGREKVLGLAYSRREARDRRLLSRDPDRSWCHSHTMSMIKLFWSQPMAPWTSAAAYECAAAQSMEPWAATKEPLSYSQRGGDTSSCPVPSQRPFLPNFTQARPRIFTLLLEYHFKY